MEEMEITSRVFLIRGLEHHLIIEYGKDYDTFSIANVFKTYDVFLDEWLSDRETEKLLRVMAIETKKEFDFDDYEEELYPTAIFLNVLQYCSLKAFRYFHEINFIFFMFKELRDVQWLEKEICILLDTGIRPTIPISEECLELRVKVGELQAKLLERKRRRIL